MVQAWSMEYLVGTVLMMLAVALLLGTLLIGRRGRPPEDDA